MSDGFVIKQHEGITHHIFIHSEDSAVDEWAAAFHKLMADTPEDHPFYVLMDVSGKDVYFTANARETTQKLFTAYRQRKGYIAFIFVWVTGPHIAKLFLSSLGKLEYTIESFSTAAEGLTWLHSIRED